MATASSDSRDKIVDPHVSADYVQKRKVFVAPKLVKEQSLPNVTTAFFGTFSP